MQETAPLAWDLNVDPTKKPDEYQNHGVKGGNVVFADGHGEWLAATLDNWDKRNWPRLAEVYHKAR